MTREELQKKIEDINAGLWYAGHTSTGRERGLQEHSTTIQLLSAVDEYVAWVIGEKEPEPKVYGDGDDEATDFARHSVNDRIDEQRQRAGLEE